MSLAVSHLGAAAVDERAWLDALNLCFPGWGGADRFAWCFRRVGAGRTPDALTLADRGRTIAGTGLTYRTLALTDGRRVPAAIMTGSWTLPEARGRGAFTRLVEESRAAAAAQGAPILLAFVTEGNASRRRLEAAGAEMLPSFYCRAAGAASGAPDLEDLGEPDPAAFRAAPGFARFAYGDEEWRGQFVKRPGGVRVLGVRGSFAALVEEGPDRRVHALAAPPSGAGGAHAALAADAARAGRATFAFTTRPAFAAELERLGFTIGGGFVTALPSAAPSLSAALDTDDARRLLDLDLASGDRM